LVFNKNGIRSRLKEKRKKRETQREEHLFLNISEQTMAGNGKTLLLCPAFQYLKGKTSASESQDEDNV